MSKKESSKKNHYNIYVDWPVDAPPPHMREMKALFEDTGVIIESDPVEIRRDLYMIRGAASDDSRKKASQIRGIKFKQEI